MQKSRTFSHGKFGSLTLCEDFSAWPIHFTVTCNSNGRLCDYIKFVDGYIFKKILTNKIQTKIQIKLVYNRIDYLDCFEFYNYLISNNLLLETFKEFLQSLEMLAIHPVPAQILGQRGRPPKAHKQEGPIIFLSIEFFFVNKYRKFKTSSGRITM